MNNHSRRAFLEASGRGAVPLLLGGASRRAANRRDDLDDFIEGQRRALRIPGLAACIVKSGRIVWSKGYGWANIAKRVPMDPDRTVQNIGSISKTVVATAVMQLWEKGRFQLDDDVNERLPFASGAPPTRTRRSPIGCCSPIVRASRTAPPTDPATPAETRGLTLEAWLKAYFTPGGRYYEKAANFHPWKPGEKQSYSNIGFGLLGYLVERMSGEPFPQYSRKRIFEPLGMKRTGWLLSEIDVDAHAVPYAPAADGDPPGEELEAYRKFGLLAGEPERDPASGDHRPLCLYSFPNYPDGSLRTSVNQLARFLLAYVNDGSYGERAGSWRPTPSG